MKKRIVLIGPGRVGQAVARLLNDAGHEIRAIISRDPARAVEASRFAGCREAGTTELSRAAEGELVLIALPDDHIAEMAHTLRRKGHLSPGAILAHFSGIHPASILLEDGDLRFKALSIHPLQSFADAVMGVRNLPGSPFSVEGDEVLLPLAEELVKEMGGVPFRIRGDRKPLYHAACCVASNYMVALSAAAGEIMAACGFDRTEAFRLLLPLFKGTGKNLAVLGPEQALTGPIARGDVRTVASHCKALAELPAELGEIYRTLGKKTVELAFRKGTLGEKEGEEILSLLEKGAGSKREE